jgi:hypothetical protein
LGLLSEITSKLTHDLVIMMESHENDLNSLAGNDVELGMIIPWITSRTSLVSKLQRELYEICGSFIQQSHLRDH